MNQFDYMLRSLTLILKVPCLIMISFTIIVAKSNLLTCFEFCMPAIFIMLCDVNKTTQRQIFSVVSTLFTQVMQQMHFVRKSSQKTF